MATSNWKKEELLAYILLFAANTDFKTSNTERNIIASKVDLNTYDRIYEEYKADNDYQSLQKIQKSLNEHEYGPEDLDMLFAEIKGLFYADGEFDILERNMFDFLKRLLQ